MTRTLFEIAHQSHRQPAGVDMIINGRLFSRLGGRNQGRIFLALFRLSRSLDLSDWEDAYLADALNVELDRLSSIMAGRS